MAFEAEKTGLPNYIPAVSGAGFVPQPVSKNIKLTGGNYTFTDARTAYSPPQRVFPDSKMDLVVPAEELDIISVTVTGLVNALGGSGLQLSIWSMGGSRVRSWVDNWSTGTVDGGIAVVPGNANTPVNNSSQCRTLSTDIDANGCVTLRLMATPTAGSGGSFRLNGNRSQGPIFNMMAMNSRSDRKRVLKPNTSGWESGAGSLQEPAVAVAPDGKLWMYYTAGEPFRVGLASASHPLGPWAKYQNSPFIGGGALGVPNATARASVFVENGTYYVYVSCDGSIYVLSGAHPANLGGAKIALLSAGTYTTLQNTAVVKFNGLYYMIFESRVSGVGMWKAGLATASSPDGPFTTVEFPIAALDTTIQTQGVWMENNNGRVSIVYHGSPDGNFTPSYVYTMWTTDFVTYNKNPSPILAPLTDFLENQASDPWMLKYQDKYYLFVTDQQDPELLGGIDVTIPERQPIVLP